MLLSIQKAKRHAARFCLPCLHSPSSLSSCAGCLCVRLCQRNATKYYKRLLCFLGPKQASSHLCLYASKQTISTNILYGWKCLTLHTQDSPTLAWLTVNHNKPASLRKRFPRWYVIVMIYSLIMKVMNRYGSLIVEENWLICSAWVCAGEHECVLDNPGWVLIMHSLTHSLTHQLTHSLIVHEYFSDVNRVAGWIICTGLEPFIQEAVPQVSQWCSGAPKVGIIWFKTKCR